MVPSETSPKDPGSVLAGTIAARRWGAGRGVGVRPLGQGSNNTLYLAVGGDERLVIKLSQPHREAVALDEYRKEAWCAGRARELDVATPEVLECGLFDGRAFQVQSFVAGRAPSASEALSTWQALGGYARRINSLPVAGWGRTLAADGRFAESWTAHLAYNIAALGPGDELVARGFLTEASSLRLRDELEHLGRRDFRLGLCHGDIALWNTLIDGSGRPWLLDWGCAASAVVPHHEINEILRTARPGKPQLAAFLTGYGLSAKDMAAMAQELRVLAALRETDTLRWAIEKQPAMIASLGDRARRAAADLD
jgi:Ser/Thr protein kinase RdoA (MazF antagonist)